MPTEDTLEEIKDELKAIRRWSRVQGLVALREIVADFDDDEKLMFNAADGDTKRNGIANEAGVSTGTVSNRMGDWMAIGIIEKDGRQWRHVASLPEMGLEVPEIPDED